MHIARKLSTRLIATAIIAVLIGCKAPPTASPTQDEASRLLSTRAVEAVLWGMPAVNYDLMLQQKLTSAPAKVNDIIYWGRQPLTARNQTLTPNPDVLTFMVFFNTKDGPIVLDLPPSTATGSFHAQIVTAWQTPLADAGLLGRDKGKGAKYLILPPGYKDKPPAGFVALRSDTFGGYMLFQSKPIRPTGHTVSDVAYAITYGKKIRVYPLADAARPHFTNFTDANNIDFNSTIPYDSTFFDHLNNIIQSEPWQSESRPDGDHTIVDHLASLGIVKGKPFQPNDHTRALLTSAAQDAHKSLDAQFDRGFPPFFSPTSHWTYPQPSSDLNASPVDDRAIFFSYANIALKRLDSGQLSLLSIRDNNGNAFDGAKTYKLTVPPDAPITGYWSVTAYDRETHTLLKDMPRANRSSQIPDLQKNADGSIDIYFGPTAPAGKDSNWIPTDPHRPFELIFRAYGAKPAFFEKKWTLRDVVLIQ